VGWVQWVGVAIYVRVDVWCGHLASLWHWLWLGTSQIWHHGEPEPLLMVADGPVGPLPGVDVQLDLPHPDQHLADAAEK